MLNQLTYCRWTASMRASGRARSMLHMGRVVPQLDPDLARGIEDKSINPKQLKTKRKFGFVSLPALLRIVAEKRLSCYSDRSFRKEASILINAISKFKLPDDEHTLRIKKSDLETELESRGKIFASKEPEIFEDNIKERDELADLIKGTIAERRRDWHYYEYDERASLLYMAARLAPNFACIRTVMKEIFDLDPAFKPKSVLDFGSGMGTTIWAVNETWPNEVNEFMNIEISREQQHLCEYLLKGGQEIGGQLQGVFHRQYLPVSNQSKYDLVVSAFSLLELPSSEMRASVIENLWSKTNDILVFIERGNRGGFTAINEARNFVLDMTGHDVTKKINLVTSSTPVSKRIIPRSHVFAPCSHEFICPRGIMTSKKNMDICRFRLHFEPLEFGRKKPGLLDEEFSYVVIRKRPHDSYTYDHLPPRWPRIVEPRRKRGSRVIHKICCPNGCLAETMISKAKYGSSTYDLARMSDWGDILPVKVCDTYEVKGLKLLKSGKE